MRLYPQTTINRNVPQGVFLLVETQRISGEIETTYYATSAGEIRKVGDCIGDKPLPADFCEVTQIMNGTYAEIHARWKAYFKEMPQYAYVPHKIY